MIQRIESDYYTQKLAEVYNSANELFPENERYPADASVFSEQIKNDANFVCEKNGDLIGFMSFRKHEDYYILTSLYVHFEHQRHGIGTELLHHFEKLIPEGSFVIVKALNASPWAIQFYSKHGYTSASETQLHAWRLTQRPWETVLCKYCG